MPSVRTGRSRVEAERLRSAAIDVLRCGDRGGATAMASSPVVLPPHGPYPWRWDATLTAIGLSRIDVPRAIAELRGILAAQWSTGMLPQTVFGADAIDHVPDPDRWGTDDASARPRHVRRSGLCAPPGHAIAMRAVLDRGRDNGGADLAAAEDYAAGSFDGLLAWHRWIIAARDPDGTGLLEIHHPWESGFDHSARWDRPLSRTGPSAAASRADRHLWLIDQMRDVEWADDAVRDVGEFRVRDVFLSAVLAATAEVLADLGDEVGRSDATSELKDDAARFRHAVTATIDPDTGLARDVDVRTGEWLATATVAGFAPLVAGGDPEVLAAQRTVLLGDDWMGHAVLRYPLPPTMSPSSPGFRRREPWRGPTWPAFDMLLGWASARDSAWDLRAVLRDAALDQLADHAFGEFYEPITGQPLGAGDHVWTAAAALEWLG